MTTEIPKSQVFESRLAKAHCKVCMVRLNNLRYRVSKHGGSPQVITIGKICPKCKTYTLDKKILGVEE